MKLAILNDTHFGVRNASDVFLNYAEDFFVNTFFPHCKKHGIRRILHAGDFFDNRRFLSIKVLERIRSIFLDRLVEYDIQMDIVLGNHDVYYKSTNSLHSLKSTLSDHSHITVHEKPIDLMIGDLSIAMIPWINDENQDEIEEFLRETKSQIVLGHFELAGFEMMKGSAVTSHGYSPEILTRFEAVYSGHYHTKSSCGNIHYLGCQFELTWSDANDPKYFHILDTSTREVEAVRYEKCLFHKIIYDDSKFETKSDIRKIDFRFVKNGFVKIVVISKKGKGNAFLDLFYDRIMKNEPHDVRIIESSEIELNEEDFEKDLDGGILSLDTATLIHRYIDNLDLRGPHLKKDILKSLVTEIYTEAQNYDSI